MTDEALVEMRVLLFVKKEHVKKMSHVEVGTAPRSVARMAAPHWRTISQTKRMMNSKNDRYPKGMNRNASPADNKNGLGSAYKRARRPPCRKKSNARTATQASKVTLIIRRVDL